MTKKTDHSFFTKFFDDTPSRKCNRCGATADLVPVGSATGGARLYLCRACKAKRDKESRERAERNRAEVEADLARDHWEESF